jgi:hypothetical protein
VNNCVEDRLFRHDRRDSYLSTVSTISQYPCYCIRSPYGVYEPLLLVGSTIIGLQAKQTRINPDKRAGIPKLRAHQPTCPPAPCVDPGRETSSPSVQSISLAKTLSFGRSLFIIVGLFPPVEFRRSSPRHRHQTWTWT